MLEVHKPTPPADAGLEAMAAALEASGLYRIRRKLRPKPKLEVPAGIELKQSGDSGFRQPGNS